MVLCSIVPYKMSHIEICAYRTNIGTMQTSQLWCFIADRKYILPRIFYVYFKTKVKIAYGYMNLFYYTSKLVTTAKRRRLTTQTTLG